MSQSIPEPQLEACPSSRQPQVDHSVASLAEDDLPPSSRKDAGKKSTRNNTRTQPITKVWSWRKPLLLVGFLLAMAAYWTWSGSEASHQNWANHEQATSHWEDPQDAQPMKWVTPMGPAQFVATIPIGIDDFDRETTEAVLDQGYGGESATIDQIVVEAQQDLADASMAIAKLPDSADLDPVSPSLTPGMRSEIMNGDARFFHIFLYDSCAQDGDIVDIVLNGHRFATVPITNAGTTLSVPVASMTSVAIRGLWDGGGGITVACQTSQGNGFIRVLQVGEEQLLTIVGQ